MDEKRVGLIGLGDIAQDLIELIELNGHHHINLVGAVVRDVSRTDRVLPTYSTVEELLDQGVDVVVEIAGHAGLIQHGPSVLEAGTDLIIVSVGALADQDFENRMRKSIATAGARLRVVTGAIGALDVLAATALGKIDYVKHTVYWFNTPEMHPDEIAALTEPKLMLKGSAREAALRFPKRVNVTAASSFAGIGLDETQVEIYLDPTLETNLHRIEAQGSFGFFRFDMHQVPVSDGNKGGQLVAKSILHELLVRDATFSIG